MSFDEEERDYQRWLSRQPDVRNEPRLYSRAEMELFADVAVIKERNEIAEMLLAFGNDPFMPYGARIMVASAAHAVLKRNAQATDTEKAPGPSAEEPFANLDVEEVTSLSTLVPPQ